MKRKTRFNDGGLNRPEGGRFDDDIYARARRFIEENERRAGEGMANEEAPVRRRAPISAPPVRMDENYGNEGRSRSAPVSAQIPTGDYVAPPSTGVEPSSDLERNLGAIGAGLGGLGALGGIYRATKMAQKAREAARAGEKAREGLSAATRAGIAADRAQPARSTAGKTADIQEALKSVPRRAEASKKNKKAAEDMASARRRARTKDDSEAGIEFSKGGSVSRRADGVAQRGKTRGKMY